MKIFKKISIYIISILILLISIIFFVTKNEKNHDYLYEQENQFPQISELNKENHRFFLDLIWAVEPGELADPASLYLNDDYIVVQDFQSIRPLPVLNKDGSFSHYIGKWGKGPGEFSSDGHTVLGVRNGNVLIYDRETSRLLAFDIETGNFVAEKLTEPKTFPYLQGDRLVSRAAVPYEHFAYGVTLAHDLTAMADTVIFGDYSRLEKLSFAKDNHLLKQGAITVDNKQNAYIAFNNSSLILGFDLNGEIIFENDEPVKMGELPDLKNIKLPASHREALISPPLNMFPKHYVAVATNETYLAGLYSGFQIKNRQDYLDAYKANEGKILHVFDKTGSKFLYRVNLEEAWTAFTLNQESVFAISLYPEVRIKKYNVRF